MSNVSEQAVINLTIADYANVDQDMLHDTIRM